MKFDQQNFESWNYPFNLRTYDHRTPYNFIYSARRNTRELTKLINRLFEHHSRLLVIRIDLRYKKEIANQISVETVQMHRDRLLADRRLYPDLYNGLVGYAWGLEYGEHGGGYHIHLLAIFDGAIRHGDIAIGMGIGSLWDQITQGGGEYYLSNFDKERLAQQQNLGIGMIHRDDGYLRVNLVEKVAAYITKKCTAFDVQSDRTDSGDFRTFGKSQMPRAIDPGVPRRGRPPVSHW